MLLGSKNKKHLRHCSGDDSPGHYTNPSPTGLGQYNGLGEYCCPHTASSVFIAFTLGVEKDIKPKDNKFM